ncbi:MAG TPA: hypothetical protein VKC89_02680 [Patescibacteria group bacterium]|nr:hypothetical protein [Patescibacteria group bacterium]
MDKRNLVNLLLRISIASVFLYAAVSATLNPDNWIGYLPQYLKNLFPAKQLLLAFSFYEVALSLWILSGKKGFYAGLLSAATLLGIIVTNFRAIDITFRDLAIFFSSIALAIDSKD